MTNQSLPIEAVDLPCGLQHLKLGKNIAFRIFGKGPKKGMERGSTSHSKQYFPSILHFNFPSSSSTLRPWTFVAAMAPQHLLVYRPCSLSRHCNILQQNRMNSHQNQSL
jgi:hypothetical protein